MGMGMVYDAGYSAGYTGEADRTRAMPGRSRAVYAAGYLDGSEAREWEAEMVKGSGAWTFRDQGPFTAEQWGCK